MPRWPKEGAINEVAHSPPQGKGSVQTHYCMERTRVHVALYTAYWMVKCYRLAILRHSSLGKRQEAFSRGKGAASWPSAGKSLCWPSSAASFRAWRAWVVQRCSKFGNTSWQRRQALVHPPLLKEAACFEPLLRQGGARHSKCRTDSPKLLDVRRHTLCTTQHSSLDLVRGAQLRLHDSSVRAHSCGRREASSGDRMPRDLQLRPPVLLGEGRHL